MTINEELRTQLLATFAPLNTKTAAKKLPSMGKLSETLNALASKTNLAKKSPPVSKKIDKDSASFFATAAVEIWLRGVHSFLISTSLTNTSPIWASVSGYYSSHYSVRGIAHLLGFFYLFDGRKLARLSLGKKNHACEFSRIKSFREHQFYWERVKQDAMFTGDALFTENKKDPITGSSDAAHRDKANYADHVNQYPIFNPLDKKELQDRIEYISKIVFDEVPHPKLSEFPDLEHVQVLAYHRLVRFRKILDDVLGGKNKFWNAHRNPPFATDYLNFQLAEGGGPMQPNT